MNMAQTPIIPVNYVLIPESLHLNISDLDPTFFILNNHPASEATSTLQNSLDSPKIASCDIQFLQLLQELSPVEVNAPVLEDTTRTNWQSFKTAYSDYKLSNGTKTMVQLFRSTAVALYPSNINVTPRCFKHLSNRKLIKHIDLYHNVADINHRSAFSKLAMPSRSLFEYVRDDCETYKACFSMIIHTNPTLRGSKPNCLNDEVLIDFF